MEGGTEDDALGGNEGTDHLLGDEGDDILRGFGEADTLEGGPGADALSGGLGPDLLRGGDGGDVLHGGSGRDDLAGGAGSDFLFRSEYPSLDRMDGGPDTGEEDVVDTAKRGTLATGVRRYLTEAEALAFQGSYLLGQFTTYHNCCENRVVNIQLMADTIHGHVVLPGEVFSVNATVGQRTAAKGYLPAGAIIGAYVQCCDLPDNMGGGTSQFGTTIYNAGFFAGLEDVEHRPHSLDFDRYPDGREATMGWPHPDVAFRNDTGRPVIITTHHSGFYGTSITVRIWGDNDRRIVTAGASPRRNYYSTSAVIYEGDPVAVAGTGGGQVLALSRVHHRRLAVHDLPRRAHDHREVDLDLLRSPQGGQGAPLRGAPGEPRLHRRGLPRRRGRRPGPRPGLALEPGAGGGTRTHIGLTPTGSWVRACIPLIRRFRLFALGCGGCCGPGSELGYPGAGLTLLPVFGLWTPRARLCLSLASMRRSWPAPDPRRPNSTSRRSGRMAHRS